MVCQTLWQAFQQAVHAQSQVFACCAVTGSRFALKTFLLGPALQKGIALKKSMVLMKPVKKKNAGNPSPRQRKSFPEVDQGALDDAIDNHIRQLGVKEALNLFEYKNLAAQQAEIPKAIFKLHPLLSALIGVSPSAEIKYRNLKQSLVMAVNKFGVEVLQFWDVEAAMLPRRAADSILVLLKHWRRATGSPTSWEKFGSKLDTAQFQVLTGIYKKTGKKYGFPAMLQSSSGSEAEEFSGHDEPPEPSGVSDQPSNSLLQSPPPATKKIWRDKAGKPTKTKPAAAGQGQKKESQKKPAAKTKRQLKRTTWGQTFP